VAVGSKIRKALILVIALVLQATTAYASTASDVYAVYDMSYEPSYPKGVLSTIAAYQNAKKYVYMYQYVIESEYDTTLIDRRIEEYKKTVETTSEKLLGGFSLDLSEIYALEDQYTEAVQKKEEAELSLVSYTVDYEAPTAKDVPTYAEYQQACTTKSLIDNKANVGTLENLSYPTETACLIDSSNDTSMTFATSSNTVVTSLFNGKVAKVTDDSVTVCHYNKIYTCYSNLSSVTVKKGDIVCQGQSVGISTSKFTLRMKVGGKLVDVSKLFKEDTDG
jgi:murein DD-endopeptidase MepM/ murein hydrolase activator NlpD